MSWGRDIATSVRKMLAGTELGFDYAIGHNVNAGATAGGALTDAATTRLGGWPATASIRFPD